MRLGSAPGLLPAPPLLRSSSCSAWHARASVFWRETRTSLWHRGESLGSEGTEISGKEWWQKKERNERLLREHGSGGFAVGAVPTESRGIHVMERAFEVYAHIDAELRESLAAEENPDVERRILR